MQTTTTTRVRLSNGKFGSIARHPTAPIADFRGTPQKRKRAKKGVSTNNVAAGLQQTIRTIFVVDRSGSMAPVMSAALQALQTQMERLEVLDRDHKQTTKATLIKFDTEVETVFEDLNIKDVQHVSHYNMHSRGMTSLYDATKKAIQTAERLHIVTGEKGPVIITILTDGAENSSQASASELDTLIQRVQGTDLFTIAFLVPPGHKRNITDRLQSVHAGNVMEWERTVKGVEMASAAISAGLASTYSGIARGVRHSKQFFEVTASKLDPTTVRAVLNNISNNVKFMTVDKESQISEFITNKVGYYRRGNAYYQLTKKETLRPGRQFLIQERGKSAVYAGPQARALLGITTDTEEVRIEPGNLGNWVVYAQSESVNRLLVRGTKLAYILN